MSDRPRRVALLFGGNTPEHEISIQSARGVAEAMRDTPFVTVPIAVTRSGRWLPPQTSQEFLASSQDSCNDTLVDGRTARVVLEPGSAALSMIEADGTRRAIDIDVVFPLIHGWGGEDGRLQGALDLVGVPYIGAGVTGSAAGIDKDLTKRVCQTLDIDVAPWVLVERVRLERSRQAVREQIEHRLPLPVFVKPNCTGSSVGITRLQSFDELDRALALALEFGDHAIVEQGIDAREFECAVLGNLHPEASGVGEVLPSREFYDYEAKYVNGGSDVVIPAELDAGASEAMRALALRAFQGLRLCGLARVDFLMDRKSSRIFLNEVNTLPGFTTISMFSKLWDAAGLSYPRLIERLVALALRGDGIEHG